MSDVLNLLDRAYAAHRQETVHATAALLNDLLGRNREVRDIRIKPGAGAVMVTVDAATIRLAMPSAGQGLALRDLWQRGPVILAMGLALDDGRAMLGFSGVDEDVIVSTRVSRAVASTGPPTLPDGSPEAMTSRPWAEQERPASGLTAEAF